MTGIGLNIDLAHLNDAGYARLQKYLQKAQPKMIVCMDNWPRTVELARMFPQMIVVFRHYLRDDVWEHNPPSVWFNVHAAYGRPPANVWFYALNEPPLTEASIRWLEAIAYGCLERGWRCVLANMSVGMPHHEGWWLAEALLRLIARNPLLMLGLHEYFPTYAPYEYQQQIMPPLWWPRLSPDVRGWFLGRYRWLLAYCAQRGIPPPRIAITEFGCDTVPAVIDWQRTTPGYEDRAGYHVAKRAWAAWDRGGLSVGQYAGEMARWAWREIYQRDVQIVGLAWFCAGGQGDWDRKYNVVNEADFLEAVSEGFEMSSKMYEVRALGTVAQQVRVELPPGVALNVRALPTLSAPAVTRLTNGQVTTAWMDSDAVNFDATRYSWWRVDGGWIARITGLALVPVSAPPDTDRAKMLGLLDGIQNNADALQALLEAQK